MFSPLFDAVKRNHFSSPFVTARCEGSVAPTLPSENVSQITPSKIATPMLASPAEETSCEFGSAKYYALCGFGGILSCGVTHTALVPLDLVKCRIQVDPVKYVGIFNGFKVTLKEEGFRALGKGWAPTAIGYSMQGLCKFGFYEVFKSLYSNLLGEERTFLYRTSLYLAASASAEFFADIALAPMEAVKVRVQTQPGFATTLREGAPKLWAMEGIRGFYKGLPPLWLRQIPYTMMKFACFERTVEFLYKYVVPKPRSECTKPEQLVITFLAGYIAGVFCAIVSHPADTVVSKLNQDSGSTPIEAAKKTWHGRSMEGSLPAYHHDRYADRPAVVHLRLGQGLLQAAPPSTTGDAREPQEKAGGQGRQLIRTTNQFKADTRHF